MERSRHGRQFTVGRHAPPWPWWHSPEMDHPTCALRRLLRRRAVYWAPPFFVQMRCLPGWMDKRSACCARQGWCPVLRGQAPAAVASVLSCSAMLHAGAGCGRAWLGLGLGPAGICIMPRAPRRCRRRPVDHVECSALISRFQARPSTYVVRGAATTAATGRPSPSSRGALMTSRDHMRACNGMLDPSL